MKRVLATIIMISAGLLTLINTQKVLMLGFPKPFAEVVYAEAEKYQIDELLIYSVMRAESKYDENAVSYAGAKGLMQITDDTFDMISRNTDVGNDVFDPETNIKAAVWYLDYLYTLLEDIDSTIRAYNCGINNLNRKIAQTEIFRHRVLEFYEIYRTVYLN